MSILSISEEIGYELKNTKEGKMALQLYERILENDQEQIMSLFFNLINKRYIQDHFYAIPNAVQIFRSNEDNQRLGVIVKKTLENEEIEAFEKSNLCLARFVDDISKTAFDGSVKYQLNDSVSFTPKLVRLSNMLTVDCLRTNILQQFLKDYHNNPGLINVIAHFDELCKKQPIFPYSRDDRACLRALKKEFSETCSSQSIENMYSMMSILAFIKSMIFDAFYGNVFDVYEGKEVLNRREKALKNSFFVQLKLIPDARFMCASTGWILKLYNNDGSISYGQIFNKSLHFSQNEERVTIKAIIYSIL